MPVGLAHAVGVDPPIEWLGYWPELMKSYEWEYDRPPVEFMGALSKRVVRREPGGVVAGITPWNYPFQLNLAKLGAPLAAGCTVVLKGAPDTLWSATLLAQAVAETDIPAGVVNIITTRDNSVAEILTTHREVDHVTFTGSTQTGRLIMRNGAETIKKVSLELGGKSAAIVLDDADLASVIPAAAGIACMHSGRGLCPDDPAPGARVADGGGVRDRQGRVLAVPARRPQRPGQHDGPAHQPASARPGARVHGEGEGRGRPAHRWWARGAVRQGLLRPADRLRRCQQ
nr:aldehyde dehydrogenase family protein [Janibacter limosus]